MITEATRGDIYTLPNMEQRVREEVTRDAILQQATSPIEIVDLIKGIDSNPDLKGGDPRIQTVILLSKGELKQNDRTVVATGKTPFQIELPR